MRNFACIHTLSLLSFLLSGCFGAELLSPEPSAQDVDFTDPSCPGITAVEVTAGPSLTIEWDQAGDNVSSSSDITYIVYKKLQGQNYNFSRKEVEVIGDLSAVIAEGVDVGRTYVLFVQCKDENNNVDPIGPENEYTVSVPDVDPPSALTDLSATVPSVTDADQSDDDGYNTVNLSWSASSDGEGGSLASEMVYRIYRSTSSPVDTSGTPTASITGINTYSATALSPSTTYYFRVVAQDIASNKSSDSNEVSGTTYTDSAAPTFTPAVNIVFSNVSSTQMDLDWTAADDAVTPQANLTYEIHRCVVNSCDPFASPVYEVLAGGVTSYTDDNRGLDLSPSTEYTYGIRVVDAAGNRSANTDSYSQSTSFDSTGSFLAYPTLKEAYDRFGQSIAIGEFYGATSGATQYLDIAVGTPYAHKSGSVYLNTGCVFIFEGQSDGQFSDEPVSRLCSPENSHGNGLYNIWGQLPTIARNFGFAVASGDFNNDGLDDLVVSEPRTSKAYVYLHQSAGTQLSSSPSSINATADYSSGNYLFGYQICTGDIDGNGDGDDFIFTVPHYNCGAGAANCNSLETGVVSYWKNTSTGPGFSAPGAETQQIKIYADIEANTALEGNIDHNDKSIAKSCFIGEIDDGQPGQLQMVIGGGNYGQSPTTNRGEGLLTFYRITAPETFTFQNAIEGISVGSVLDSFWGDSIAIGKWGTTWKAYIGAPEDNSQSDYSGKVYEYNLSVNGGSSDFELAQAGLSLSDAYDQDRNGFGTSLALGDIDKDGLLELSVGSGYEDRLASNPGTWNIDVGDVYTFAGAAAGVNPSNPQYGLDFNPMRVQVDQQYGTCLAKGDVNNDGNEDIIVGSWLQNYSEANFVYAASQGAIYIYYGKSSGETDFDEADQTLFEPASGADARYGISCHVMDFNRDGLDDLLVGASQKDLGGNNNRGSVFVYLGAASTAVPSSPTFTIITPSSYTENNGDFGWDITSGDFDDNGETDLVISAVSQNVASQNSGRVFIYWGDSTTGQINLSESGDSGVYVIDRPNTDISPQSGANTGTSNSEFGASLQSFRANADTIDDLIICARYWDIRQDYLEAGKPSSHNNGRWAGNCFIYTGTATEYALGGGAADMGNPGPLPDGEIRFPSNIATRNDHPYVAYFGTSMTSGDWDDDGNNDLVICAARMRQVELGALTWPGACFAYFGVAGGGFFSSYSYDNGYHAGNGVNFSILPRADDAWDNPNFESESRFGSAVLMADINNNNRDDLLVGERASENASGPANLGRNSGRVYIDRGDFAP